MIHHYNHKAFIILVLFKVPCYHFLFSRYLDLTECHFLSDIFIPFPDLSNLYSRDHVYQSVHTTNLFRQLLPKGEDLSFRERISSCFRRIIPFLKTKFKLLLCMLLVFCALRNISFNDDNHILKFFTEGFQNLLSSFFFQFRKSIIKY